MKRFFKILYYGILAVFNEVLGFWLGGVIVASLCTEISELSGWWAVLSFALTILTVFIMIGCLISLGKHTEEYKQLKADKEKEDNNAT